MRVPGGLASPPLPPLRSARSCRHLVVEADVVEAVELDVIARRHQEVGEPPGQRVEPGLGLRRQGNAALGNAAVQDALL